MWCMTDALDLGHEHLRRPGDRAVLAQDEVELAREAALDRDDRQARAGPVPRGRWPA